MFLMVVLQWYNHRHFGLLFRDLENGHRPFIYDSDFYYLGNQTGYMEYLPIELKFQVHIS